MTTKISRVIVTIIPPREADGYEGQVEEGFYTFEDGQVELVTHAGLPRRDRSGKAYAKTLGTGEDAHLSPDGFSDNFINSTREELV